MNREGLWFIIGGRGTKHVTFSVLTTNILRPVRRVLLLCLMYWPTEDFSGNVFFAYRLTCLIKAG